MLDSSVAITADRVASILGHTCLLNLLQDLLSSGTLVATREVVEEFCGQQGSNCRSVVCRKLCSNLHPGTEIPPRDVTILIVHYGLDIGEASALALAHKIAIEKDDTKLILLTSDHAARIAAEELEIEVHGDLYLLEQAKKLGYCSPQEAAAITRQLPRLGRHIASQTLEEAARRLENQSGLGYTTSRQSSHTTA